jgi:hypothetical protein
MQSVSVDESRTRDVKRPDGNTGRRSDYFGSPGIVDAQPQAFLVELPYAGARVNPHFHDIDQFQVIVAGDGRIGKKLLAPITFQYADAYTPYGPIVANDDGISFFTLRNVASGGHFVMPGSRHLMPCRAGRNIAGSFGTDLGGAQGVVVSRLIDLQDDGVAAFGVTLGPNARTESLPVDAGGQYYLVCAGALTDAGRALSSDSLVRVEPGETPFEMEAGPEGAAILVLQFGRPTARPGSDPNALAARDPQGYVERKAPGH